MIRDNHLPDRMEEYFGDRVSESGPKEWLEEQGYYLTPECYWLSPAGHQPTLKELECIVFLIERCSYGPLSGSLIGETAH